MMDSPPQLSPPPELKSCRHRELVIHELVVEHLVRDNAAEDDFCRFRTRVEGNHENGEHEVSTEHCCIEHVGLAR